MFISNLQPTDYLYSFQDQLLVHDQSENVDKPGNSYTFQ